MDDKAKAAAEEIMRSKMVSVALSAFYYCARVAEIFTEVKIREKTAGALRVFASYLNENAEPFGVAVGNIAGQAMLLGTAALFGHHEELAAERSRWGYTLMFEPHDAWVGLYWRSREDALHLYVCPVPFVVVHATRQHEVEQPSDFEAMRNRLFRAESAFRTLHNEESLDAWGEIANDPILFGSKDEKIVYCRSRYATIREDWDAFRSAEKPSPPAKPRASVFECDEPEIAGTKVDLCMLRPVSGYANCIGLYLSSMPLSGRAGDTFSCRDTRNIWTVMLDAGNAYCLVLAAAGKELEEQIAFAPKAMDALKAAREGYFAQSTRASLEVWHNNAKLAYKCGVLNDGGAELDYHHEETLLWEADEALARFAATFHKHMSQDTGALDEWKAAMERLRSRVTLHGRASMWLLKNSEMDVYKHVALTRFDQKGNLIEAPEKSIDPAVPLHPEQIRARMLEARANYLGAAGPSMLRAWREQVEALRSADATGHYRTTIAEHDLNSDIERQMFEADAESDKLVFGEKYTDIKNRVETLAVEYPSLRFPRATWWLGANHPSGNTRHKITEL